MPAGQVFPRYGSHVAESVLCQLWAIQVLEFRAAARMPIPVAHLSVKLSTNAAESGCWA
jgi:hypothetical protein